MGKGLVERLKQEFDLQVEWIGVEIHPDTPARGRPITELFPRAQVDRMVKNLRSMGAPFGIIFSDITWLSNSRLALQAAEFSKEQGRFEAFHDALLHAYFSEGLDIGDREVISQIAEHAGLDVPGLEQALDSGKYLPRLREMQEEAGRAGVTGVPHFIIGGRKTIVGAQPLDVFRSTLRSLK